ncbi:sucrose phosphorylase [Methylomarinovum tepidoasis]|uniref:Sucrose phosphorylase n=1 Tax=Methylomarinovum tepidoasis TaxID=2840183 RepID=A0AAU9C3C5_9GAMM|nr:alpha-amylase family glycosyl hydrolase [Methylomarinovum sp. IN45]BCX87897.1 sucrose phosphorylase [Methylomarinovum sp. IN45]
MNGRFPSEYRQRIRNRLAFLYGEAQADALTDHLLEKLAGFAPETHPAPPSLWRERDLLLITYGDSIRSRDETPLRTLHRFLTAHLGDAVSSVHILPYFPYSSDDGFAVIDYLRVNPALGDWPDVEAIARDFRLMTDLVINHVSSRHAWFQNYLRDLDPGRDYFIEVDPGTDLSQVVRPRTTPLLTRFETVRGPRWLWTTFSPDQIDVNFQNPKVLFEYLDILLYYLGKGSRMIRLDAIAYLWKKIGTPCIHLPETHEVVKLLRDVVAQAAPDTLLITETNVPHRENISYFGQGDEAHVVYQFPLPPLVLHALYTGDVGYLNHWAANLEPPPPGCTFLNFLACHDGIGLRPLEGIVPPEEIDRLVAGMQELGGLVSWRATPDGGRAPYELNIAWFSAMQGTAKGRDGLAVERHRCAHAIMLALQGIPAFYILSLLGTENDREGVEQTGAPRAINRHKWDLDALQARLADPHSPQARVFTELRRLAGLRRRQPAFHPDAPQQVLDLDPAIFAVRRQTESQTLLAFHNVTATPRLIPLPGGQWHELLSGERVEAEIALPPYGVAWLALA